MWGNPAIDIDVYVDVIDFPNWVSETELRVIDLDLDVIRLQSGQVVLDDEDEFVENTSARRYPADVVETARATADELVEAVARRRAPFGDQSLRWRDMASSHSDFRS
jgi:protein associated with RNAse G/E